ncbi:hypothetical protein CesoFtcFv8_009151 [Champsocephalus esox]|uniref:Uncharacterized protein n=1 Tax=Champsocephalus esox TaxID=159716 RepID=A0AAN8CC07_9TELE|nr:hypothetical protein CesoFtcFv8_009151 [Champsocephalus esox]
MKTLQAEKATYVENLTEAIAKEREKELREKEKLPSDFTPPSEETMRHKGKQKHRAEWRHMEESKMAKINKCCRNEVLFSSGRGRRKCDEDGFVTVD